MDSHFQGPVRSGYPFGSEHGSRSGRTLFGTTPAGDRLLFITDGASVTNPIWYEFFQSQVTAFNGTTPVVSIISRNLDDTGEVSEFAIADLAANVVKNRVYTVNKKILLRYTVATGAPTAGDIYAFVRVAGCPSNTR